MAVIFITNFKLNLLKQTFFESCLKKVKNFYLIIKFDNMHFRNWIKILKN